MGRARLTTEQFVAKARAVHGAKYDYTDATYVHSLARVAIRCPSHGLFMQLAGNHLHGQGCPTCGRAANLEQLHRNHKAWRASMTVSPSCSREKADSWMTPLTAAAQPTRA